jgi:hypothetical protein
VLCTRDNDIFWVTLFLFVKYISLRSVLEPFKTHVAQEVHENHLYHVLQTSCATIFERQTHSASLTIDIINGTVNQLTGIEPGAAITTFNKVSYPIDVDIYSGGKFDLGSLLASIPGRLLRGVSGLVSGLPGSEEQSGYTGEQGQSKELSLEDLSPALIRQLKRLLRAKSEE